MLFIAIALSSMYQVCSLLHQRLSSLTQFPKGASRWAKDADGNIHVYDINDTEYANELYVVTPLAGGSYTFSTKDVTVNDCAFMREHVSLAAIFLTIPPMYGVG